MKLEVYAERAGSSLHVGTIETTPVAGESFTYCSEWLSDPAARPLSVTLPLRLEPFPAKKMRPYFEGLLPEEGARRALASRVRVSYASYVKLLNAVGRECIGAVSLQGPGETPEDSYSRIDADMLERLASQGFSVAAATSERARFSLAGSQAKVALYRGSDGAWYEPSASLRQRIFSSPLRARMGMLPLTRRSARLPLESWEATFPGGLLPGNWHSAGA